METASEQIAAGGRNMVTIDPPTTPRVSVESRRIDEPRVYMLYTRTTYEPPLSVLSIKPI